MTTHVLATVILADTDGLPKDEAQNSFSFYSADADATTLATAIAGASILPAFYNTAYGGRSIAAMLGSSRDRGSGATLTKYYDLDGHLDGTPHGSPVLTESWTLAARESGAINLPLECAIALSFHSDLTGVAEFSGSTRPRSRDRGRVFLGPLVTFVFTTGAHPMVDSGIATTITDAAEDLADHAAALTVPAFWAVWSRANAAMSNVVGGWVDDAPDTIRGRGQAPTTKTTFTV